MVTEVLTDVAMTLPAIVAAIIVLIIGYFVGKFLGKAVNKVIEKMGLEKSFDETDTGKSFRSAGMDLSSFIGGIVNAFIIVISVVIAIEILSIGGVVGDFLVDIAAYLPRLLGGVVIIVLGTVLVGFLATLVGNTLKPVFPAAKSEIADMLKNLLQIGLVAVILLIALDLMLLSGELVYPLILGFVIIGAGIALTDGLIKSITDDHKDFVPVAGYAKFVLYSIFLVIGAGGTLTEAIQDTSFRVCPLDKEEIHKAILELKISKVIPNLNKLVDVIKKFSDMDIIEADLNPIIVNEKKVTIVDARVRI